MLDNILNSVKRGAERVQRRGEEVAQVARLKMEVFQLTRELDGHYARLGRAYHSGADVDLLQGVREDIRRTEEDIAGRERLISELGDDGDTAPDNTSAEPEAMARASAKDAEATTSLPNSPADNRPNFTDPNTDKTGNQP